MVCVVPNLTVPVLLLYHYTATTPTTNSLRVILGDETKKTRKKAKDSATAVTTSVKLTPAGINQRIILLTSQSTHVRFESGAASVDTGLVVPGSPGWQTFSPATIDSNATVDRVLTQEKQGVIDARALFVHLRGLFPVDKVDTYPVVAAQAAVNAAAASSGGPCSIESLEVVVPDNDKDHEDIGLFEEEDDILFDVDAPPSEVMEDFIPGAAGDATDIQRAAAKLAADFVGASDKAVEGQEADSACSSGDSQSAPGASSSFFEMIREIELEEREVVEQAFDVLGLTDEGDEPDKREETGANVGQFYVGEEEPAPEPTCIMGPMVAPVIPAPSGTDNTERFQNLQVRFGIPIKQECLEIPSVFAFSERGIDIECARTLAASIASVQPSAAFVQVVALIKSDSLLRHDPVLNQVLGHVLQPDSLRFAALQNVIGKAYQTLTAIFMAVYIKRQDSKGLEALFQRASDIFLFSEQFGEDVRGLFAHLGSDVLGLTVVQRDHVRGRALQLVDLVRRSIRTAWTRDCHKFDIVGQPTSYSDRKAPESVKRAEAYRMGGWAFRVLGIECGKVVEVASRKRHEKALSTLPLNKQRKILQSKIRALKRLANAKSTQLGQINE